jgi:hypothetical protein
LCLFRENRWRDIGLFWTDPTLLFDLFSESSGIISIIREVTAIVKACSKLEVPERRTNSSRKASVNACLLPVR